MTEIDVLTNMKQIDKECDLFATKLLQLVEENPHNSLSVLLLNQTNQKKVKITRYLYRDKTCFFFGLSNGQRLKLFVICDEKQKINESSSISITSNRYEYEENMSSIIIPGRMVNNTQHFFETYGFCLTTLKIYHSYFKYNRDVKYGMLIMKQINSSMYDQFTDISFFLEHMCPKRYRQMYIYSIIMLHKLDIYHGNYSISNVLFSNDRNLFHSVCIIGFDQSVDLANYSFEMKGNMKLIDLSIIINDLFTVYFHRIKTATLWSIKQGIMYWKNACTYLREFFDIIKKHISEIVEKLNNKTKGLLLLTLLMKILEEGTKLYETMQNNDYALIEQELIDVQKILNNDIINKYQSINQSINQSIKRRFFSF